MKALDKFGFVHCYEAATQRRAPALFLLHGSGGDETSLLALGRAIAPGAALLSLRGQAVEKGARRFYSRSGNPSLDNPELLNCTTQFEAFINASVAYYGISRSLVLIGFSNGANMAAHLLFRFPRKWAGVALLRGMPFDGVVANCYLEQTPVLMLSSLDDPIVQKDETEELAYQLRNAGAQLMLHWEESGHNLGQGDVLMAFDWMRRFYSGVSGSTDA